MAETTNAPSVKTATKAAPRKTASRVKPVATAEASDVTAFALAPAGTTKTYAKFNFPDGSGCVGTVYAPLGTKVVKVRLES